MVLDRVRCPLCSQADTIFRSHRNWWEKLFAIMNVYPFLCESCDYRFYAKWRHHPPAGESLD